jgi:ABC-type proline/glycine betaine transport system substrate-binding protein
MKENTMLNKFLCGVAFAALSVSAASAANSPTDKSKVNGRL